MNFEYDSINVHFDVFGQGEQRLLIIHGWGGPEVWYPFIDYLTALNLQVFTIDLPGFGQSDHPKDIIDSDYYVDVVKSFLDEFEIKSPIVLGHSLGGKVATILQSKYQLASKIILVDSAGFKRFYIDVFLKIIIAKLGKFVLTLMGKFGEETIKRQESIGLIGSADYLSAGDMKKSFRKIIGEDIRYRFQDIKVPTQIIWGDSDYETPLIDGVQIQREIKGSKIAIIKGANHFPFLTHKDAFFNIISEFLSQS